MPGEESVEITLAQLYNVIDSFGLIVKVSNYMNNRIFNSNEFVIAS